MLPVYVLGAALVVFAVGGAHVMRAPGSEIAAELASPHLLMAPASTLPADAMTPQTHPGGAWTVLGTPTADGTVHAVYYVPRHINARSMAGLSEIVLQASTPPSGYGPVYVFGRGRLIEVVQGANGQFLAMR